MTLWDRVQQALRPRGRRITLTATRALVEIRGVPDASLHAFELALQAQVEDHAHVQWVHVNPWLDRAVFAFDADTLTRKQLLAWVTQAERVIGIDPDVDHARTRGRDLPDNELLELQRSIELLAEMGGLGLGLALRLVPFSPTRLGVNLVALLSLVQLVPAFRERVERQLGADRTDFGLSLGFAFGNALAERPLSSLVEIGTKTTQLREMRARRRHWRARVDDLCADNQAVDLLDFAQAARPIAAPKGPVETYIDRASTIAASSAGVTLLTTWSLRRSAAAMFAALPLPARAGRDTFSTELSRNLAEQGAMVLAADAMQRLDRVDCVVIEGDLVSPARFFIGDITCRGSLSKEEAKELIDKLFDPLRPLDQQAHETFRLAPAQQLNVSLEREAAELAMPLLKRGSLALALTQKNRLAAVVEVRMEQRQGLDDLVSVARRSGLRVVIASDRQGDLEHEGADELVPAGDQLPAHVRRLQSEGRTVALISARPCEALGLADCGIVLCTPGSPPAWNADILCSDVTSLARLVYATHIAKTVSHQSVRLAMGAAALGTVVSLGGSRNRAGQRVMFVVNLASLFAMTFGARRAFKLAQRPMVTPRDSVPWHALDVDAVLARLRSSSVGLTMIEAGARNNADGEPTTELQELLIAVGDELFNPLSPLLAVGAGLSALAGSTMDAAMVAGVGTINAVVGGYQRFRTERAIRDLVQSADPPVRVRRGGQLERLPAKALVIGDVIELSAGERVPADLRIIEARALEVDASSLTGESLPVSKSAQASFEPQIADRSSMLFAGTAIAAGEATGVVVALGAHTEAQRGGDAVGHDLSQGGIEARLRGLINITGPLVTAAGVGLVFAGLLRGRSLDELLGSGVSLAVAAVPEGLPLLATAAQLSAARRLSERGALVRNARCIEALGRVDVLCFDKTGTLTEGRIVLRSVSDGFELEELMHLAEPRRAVLAAALRAAARLPGAFGHVDPTDVALIHAGKLADVSAASGDQPFVATGILPFESGRGYQCVYSEDGGDTLLSIKGAPELVLSRCAKVRRDGSDVTLDENLRTELNARVENLARLGLRVIAIAERRVSNKVSVDPASVVELTYVGLLAFSDPIRQTAHAAIEELRRAGVRSVMITGDHATTATAVAAELGIGTSALSGSDLAELSDDELVQRVESVSVFARVTPSQKIRLVRALQRADRVVAMAGDGANDVPAIRAANVGLAVGAQCAPSARASADIVLADARIEEIVQAIVEGRAMWSSVRDAVAILVGGNLGEIGFTLGAGLISGRPPLSPRQLLLVNFLTDVAPAMAIALRPPSAEFRHELAQQAPGAALGPVLTRDIFARALVTASGAGGAWIVGRFTGSRERANTMALAALVGTQLGQTLTLGGGSREVVMTSIGSALAMVTIIQTPGVSHAFGCRPLGPLAWATTLGSTAAATGLSVLAQRGVERVEQWLESFTFMAPATPTTRETKIYVQASDPIEPANGALT